MPSNIWSGRERYAFDICRHFKEAGWDVSVMTRDARVIDAPFEEYGIKVRHAPFHGLVDRESVRRLSGVMRDMPRGVPVIVHVHRYRDALRALLARRFASRPDIRIVSTRHCVRPARDNYLARRIYESVDAHIFVSQRVRESFILPWRKKRAPLDPGRMFVLHDSLLDAPALRPPLPARGAVTAMFHGPLRPGKGLETLVDALRIVKDRKVRMRLCIMGNGSPDYVDALRRRAQQLGVMDMIDWRKFDYRPLKAVESVHFGVVPSVVPEAFCLPAAEYMAMGRPVVCTATGAQPEFLSDNHSAIFVPPANAASLAEALCRLSGNPSLRESMGARAFTDFNLRLSWQSFTTRLTAIYIPGCHRIKT